MLITALVVALVVAVGWAVALLVAQRTALARVSAASTALAPPGSGGDGDGDRPRPASLDDALDELESTVSDAVDDRRRTARAEDRLSWALGAIGHGVVVFDHRGEVAYRNDPAATFHDRGVALSPGHQFSPLGHGNGHARLNIATSPSILAATVSAMAG